MRVQVGNLLLRRLVISFPLQKVREIKKRPTKPVTNLWDPDHLAILLTLVTWETSSITESIDLVPSRESGGRASSDF